MEPWERKRLLVLGMTYPSYSTKYYENVCTGALEEGTKRMVRIDPVPARYLDERFKRFQWISAEVRPHESDPRPESLRINAKTIVVEETIPAERASERLRLIRESPNFMRSVEALRSRQETHRTSLAAIEPAEIIGFRLERRSKQERSEWEAKERDLLSQTTLPFMQPPRKIEFPEVRFVIDWRCDDPTCDGHSMGLEEWGLHELSRKHKADPNHDEKVLDAMKRELDLSERSCVFFLGSFRSIMWNFGLMQIYSARRERQMSLL